MAIADREVNNSPAKQDSEWGEEGRLKQNMLLHILKCVLTLQLPTGRVPYKLVHQATIQASAVSYFRMLPLLHIKPAV